MHQRHIEPIRPRQKLPIDLGTTDDHHLGCGFRGLERGGHRMYADTAWGLVTGIPGEEDVAPFRQGPTQGFIGTAPHDDGLAECQGAEMPEIRREMPGQAVAATDDAVLRHGEDEGKDQASAPVRLGSWRAVRRSRSGIRHLLRLHFRLRAWLENSQFSFLFREQYIATRGIVLVLRTENRTKAPRPGSALTQGHSTGQPSPRR